MNITPLDLTGTPFADVRFALCTITPVQAAEYLKRNTKNRKVKPNTVEAYTTDIRNNAWLLTHQGIAFDATGRLIDGQHRLIAIVNAKRPVNMLITTGWPVGGKNKTMDAVDRGCQRTIADQLGLQHDMVDAKRVTHIANGIASICLGVNRPQKATTASVIEVCGLFKSEIAWILARPLKTQGIKQASVAAALAMLVQHYPKQAEIIIQRLETGAGLSQSDPLHLLRNWLMSDGMREYPVTVRNTVLNHCLEFIDGRTMKRLDNDTNTGLLRIAKLSEDRVRKVCAIYGGTPPVEIAEAIAEAAPTCKPLSAAALEKVKTLGRVFSNRDLSARLDDGANAGHWLLNWRNYGWIEPCGLEWKKTDKFGQL